MITAGDAQALVVVRPDTPVMIVPNLLSLVLGLEI